MACPNLEDLLQDGADGHAAHCADCRALLEAFAEVDVTLESGLAGLVAPPSLASTVRTLAARESQVCRPSYIPEILDFVGWAAVLTIAVILIPHYFPSLIVAVTQ
jgi:hypothetical protein